MTNLGLKKKKKKGGGILVPENFCATKVFYIKVSGSTQNLWDGSIWEFLWQTLNTDFLLALSRKSDLCTLREKKYACPQAGAQSLIFAFQCEK